MFAKKIRNCKGKILVVGPIYNKIDKFNRAISLINNYDLLIINGNFLYPEDSSIKERIDLLKSNMKYNNFIYNLGNYDLELLNSSNNQDLKDLIQSQPNVIIIEFTRGTYILVTSGGIPKGINNHEILNNNIEASFVSKIDGKAWHESYEGKIGYVISNNPLTFNMPKFYNYSCQIGNNFGENYEVYAQEADQNGLKETILL